MSAIPYLFSTHQENNLKENQHQQQLIYLLDLIEDFCQIREYQFCRLDGSTQLNDRRDSVSVKLCGIS